MANHRQKSWLLLPLLMLGAGRTPTPDSTSTRACLPCHAAQAEPLARSRHGLASGPGLWGQLPTEGPHVGTSLSCLLCHAPAADQQRWKSPGPVAAPRPGQTAMEAAMAHASAQPVAPNPAFDPQSEALGVSCTACHLEEGHIVGSGSGDPRRAPHAVRPSTSLSDPALCARCHQFGTDAAVNGKPLENTHSEWKASRWGKAGATCQSCHMPGGEHLFQGIHTPDFVRTGVEVAWDGDARSGRLTLTNTNVGHAFPTYATPQVELRVQLEDAHGTPRGPPQSQLLGRRVRFADGAWHEDADTRVLPGESASLSYALAPDAKANSVHATVRVEPDFGYIEIYRLLLGRSGLPLERRAELETALRRAERSGYVIFDERRTLPPR